MGGGGKRIFERLRLSWLERPPPICNMYQRRRFVGGGGGGVKEFKTAAPVVRGTSSDSLTWINVVIFVGVGKMNVKPRFSLQVPPPIC